MPPSPRVRHPRLLQFQLPAVSLALAALSLVVLPRPIAYDPWSWLIWGREIVHLHLDTRLAATAVKPLAIGIDTVLALTGSHVAPVLWLLLARASALAALGLAFRLGCRLGGVVAGVVALVGLAVSDEYLGYLFIQGMSEPMATAAMLAAMDRYLDGRERSAFWWLVAAGLLRAEAWPFLIVYSLWLLYQRRNWRRVVGVVVSFVVPVSWFVIDWFGSRQFFRSAGAAKNQSQGGPLLTREPGIATFKETWHLVSAPFLVLFLVALSVELVILVRTRRPRTALWLGVVAVAWVAVDAVLAQGRFATGAPRYLLPAVGLAAAVSGGFVADVAKLLGSRLSKTHAVGAIGALACVVLGLALIPRIDHTRIQITSGVHSGQRADQLETALTEAIRQAGGRAALDKCGGLVTQPFQVPVVAWQLRVPLGEVSLIPLASGVVLQNGRPAIPANLQSSYREIASAGPADAHWTIYTTCQ